jgi:hypothetical protein
LGSGVGSLEFVEFGAQELGQIVVDAKHVGIGHSSADRPL